MLTDPSIRLIVDLANVMGSRPDGWWRDRARAATRWLAQLDPLVGRTLTLPDGSVATVSEMVVVLEGQARSARGPQPSSLRVVRAERDGDSTVVAVAEETLARVGLDGADPDAVAAGRVESGGIPLVVTADRGLRDRLPPGVVLAGPGWLRRLIE